MAREQLFYRTEVQRKALRFCVDCSIQTFSLNENCPKCGREMVGVSPREATVPRNSSNG